jgi:hypothetical protein
MTQPVTQQDTGDTFVIEGVITELQVALGRENLLAQIDPRYRAGSAATGLGAALGGFHGQVAAAASVALYDGEDTENFVCLIDQQVMCGTFGGASKLPVGKKVKAVVSKHGDVLIARGILSEDAGWVWVPHAWGSKAERMANFKNSGHGLCGRPWREKPGKQIKPPAPSLEAGDFHESGCWRKDKRLNHAKEQLPGCPKAVTAHHSKDTFPDPVRLTLR